MKITIHSEGPFCCSDCGGSLMLQRDNGRDKITTGGHSVTYYNCENCKQSFEVIDTISGPEIFPYE